jgi:phosphatidylglycerophosphate synthase
MDGLIARRCKQTSRLGAYLDGIADFEFWTALTITVGVRRLWPGWLTGLVLLRWLAPVAAATRGYFTRSRGGVISSTRVGRIAGAAQAVSVGLALAPNRVARQIAGFRTGVYVVTAALMIATPLARIAHVCDAR